MHRTIIVRREYLHFIKKYSRYEKRHKNVAAHVSPAFRVEEGDQVTVGQCRPLSKTVRRTLPDRISPFFFQRGPSPPKTATILTPRAGPLQRPPCPPPYRQGGEEVQQVLKRVP